ncbi:hypothetical protein KZO01_21560 [Kurthia zopfii]|uniref:Dynamin family protein n=1 Tax=Kurthia zopfii TaxID=1650 RepID=A0A8B4QD00_9BACL|nr:dynamin family protein [Kurthia zopfii]PWI21353.1 GTP-binding protein [Kurthia zopfii]TDR34353.1 dynamin family protein [Kurthia zopfii]GEK31847.1 hypothetical protein KZO01_21560 [Kurthia zopfii]STX10545.1 Predicted GTPase [Kurthia zopfii]
MVGIRGLENPILLNEKNVNEYLVIGTMSSGKSTFLNSLIGFELFPSKNEACTAKIISYYANPARDEFLFKFKNHNKPTIQKKLDSKQIEEWNGNSEMNEVFIEGPIRSSKKKSFGVIDTPGPNNSMDKSHRKMMEKALNNSKYKKVFYILNATQLGTEDDRNLLSFVKENCSKSKIIFVVNKSDEIDDTEEENLNIVSTNVKKYLEKNGFKKPEIYFVSALSALLAIKSINKYDLTRKEIRDYKNLSILLEENLASYNINNSMKKSSSGKIENKLWNNSGIPELINIL